jgi:hypothetical protein
MNAAHVAHLQGETAAACRLYVGLLKRSSSVSKGSSLWHRAVIALSLSTAEGKLPRRQHHALALRHAREALDALQQWGYAAQPRLAAFAWEWYAKLNREAGAYSRALHGYAMARRLHQQQRSGGKGAVDVMRTAYQSAHTLFLRGSFEQSSARFATLIAAEKRQHLPLDRFGHRSAEAALHEALANAEFCVAFASKDDDQNRKKKEQQQQPKNQHNSKRAELRLCASPWAHAPNLVPLDGTLRALLNKFEAAHARAPCYTGLASATVYRWLFAARLFSNSLIKQTKRWAHAWRLSNRVYHVVALLGRVSPAPKDRARLLHDLCVMSAETEKQTRGAQKPHFQTLFFCTEALKVMSRSRRAQTLRNAAAQSIANYATQKQRQREQQRRQQQQHQRQRQHFHHHRQHHGHHRRRQQQQPSGRKTGGVSNDAEALRVLGLRPGASKRDVKRAYYKAAKTHHPDMHKSERNKEKAQAAFVKIADAYTFLTK